MEQPRIYSRNNQTYHECAKKRVLPQAEDSDFQQPSPMKKLAKTFEKSVGFSETNYTYPENLSLQKVRSQVQGLEEHNPSPSLNFTEQLKKAKLIPSVEAGIARFKTLLPKHLSERLSPKYETLLRIASETDKVLSQRKVCNYMQSFENLKGEIQYIFDMQITLEFYQRINFLQKGYYCLLRDPLKNVVVGLPDENLVLPMRKYALRKAIYCFVKNCTSEQIALQNIDRDIPCSPFDVNKTTLFFPPRPKMQLIKTTILQSQFVADLKQEIKEKETQLTDKKQRSQNTPDYSNLEGFVQKLDELFARFKVKNMYKVSILKYFAKQGVAIEDVDAWLEGLSKIGGYFTIHEVDDHTVCIINPIEKATLLKQIQAQL